MTLSNEEVNAMVNPTEKQTSEQLKAQCKECDWSKFCVQPPSMTAREVDDRIKDMGKPREHPNGKKDDGLFGTIMAGMMYAGKEVQVKNCPVFAQRLKQDKSLAERIKAIMQENK